MPAPETPVVLLQRPKPAQLQVLLLTFALKWDLLLRQLPCRLSLCTPKYPACRRVMAGGLRSLRNDQW